MRADGRWFGSKSTGTAALVTILVGGVAIEARASEFLRGDANADGSVNISDSVTLLDHLFKGKQAPAECLDALDVDDSGDINITDSIYLTSYLFQGGPPPALPYPEPGGDPTLDSEPSCGSDEVLIDPRFVNVESDGYLVTLSIPISSAFSSETVGSVRAGFLPVDAGGAKVPGNELMFFGTMENDWELVSGQQPRIEQTRPYAGLPLTPLRLQYLVADRGTPEDNIHYLYGTVEDTDLFGDSPYRVEVFTNRVQIQLEEPYDFASEVDPVPELSWSDLHAQGWMSINGLIGFTTGDPLAALLLHLQNPSTGRTAIVVVGEDDLIPVDELTYEIDVEIPEALLATGPLGESATTYPWFVVLQAAAVSAFTHSVEPIFGDTEFQSSIEVTP